MPIQRNPVAGTHNKHIPCPYVCCGQHGSVLFGNGFRAHVDGFHDLAAASGNGFFFEECAQPVKQHDAHCLRKFSDAESTHGGKAHEKVFVKHMALQNILSGSF